MTQRVLQLEPDGDAQDALAGVWIAALAECRRRTMETLDCVRDLDTDHPMTGNSIGTLLYHLAATEADWLYVEVREEAFSERILELFPWDVRDENGRLTPVRDVSLDDHLSRLEIVRDALLETYRAMSREDLLRLRTLPDYDVSPMWVVHHLIQHEAGHRAEIEIVRDLLKRECC